MIPCSYCGRASRCTVGQHHHCGDRLCRQQARHAAWSVIHSTPGHVHAHALLGLHWAILSMAVHSEQTGTAYPQQVIADRLDVGRRVVGRLREDLRRWGLLVKGHRGVNGPRCTRAGLLFCIQHTEHMGRVAA